MFAKNGGNLGATGAVAWQFERRGVVVVPADGVDEEELLLVAADGGADDVEPDGDVFQVTSAPEALSAVRAAIEAAGFRSTRPSSSSSRRRRSPSRTRRRPGR